MCRSVGHILTLRRQGAKKIWILPEFSAADRVTQTCIDHEDATRPCRTWPSGNSRINNVFEEDRMLVQKVIPK